MYAAVGLSVTAPHAMTAEVQAAPPAPQKPEPHFDILEFVIDGNTVLPAAALEEAVYPFLGADRVAADVDRARLRAGKAPGTVDVDLEVEATLPLHGSIEINNQHNQQTSALRTAATVSYDNLWQMGHSASFTYQVAPQNRSDAEVFSGSYLARIPHSDWSFLAYAVKSNSAVAALASTDVIGKGSIFGARAIADLPGSDSFFQSLTVAGMAKGEISEPVRGDQGWHIVRLMDTKPATTRPLAEVRALIVTSLRQEKQQSDQLQYVKRMVDKTPVRLNQANLRIALEAAR